MCVDCKCKTPLPPGCNCDPEVSIWAMSTLWMWFCHFNVIFNEHVVDVFSLSLQCGQTNDIMIMTTQYPVHIVHNHNGHDSYCMQLQASTNNMRTYNAIGYINIFNCTIYHIIAGLPRRLHMFSVWDVRWVPLSSAGKQKTPISVTRVSMKGR